MTGKRPLRYVLATPTPSQPAQQDRAQLYLAHPSTQGMVRGTIPLMLHEPPANLLRTLLLAVCFTVSGKGEWWDNNRGDDFHIDNVLHSEAFDSDNNSSSTQHHRPCHNCCLPARFHTGEDVPTTASCTPVRSRPLASELVHTNSTPPNNDDKFDVCNTNNALQQLDIP